MKLVSKLVGGRSDAGHGIRGMTGWLAGRPNDLLLSNGVGAGGVVSLLGVIMDTAFEDCESEF